MPPNSKTNKGRGPKRKNSLIKSLASLILAGTITLHTFHGNKNEETPKGTPAEQAQYFLEREEPKKAIKILEDHRIERKNLDPLYKGTATHNFLEIIARVNEIGTIEAGLNTEDFRKKVNIITTLFGNIADSFENYPKETIYKTREQMKRTFGTQSYEGFKNRLDRASSKNSEARTGRFLCSLVEGNYDLAMKDCDYAITTLLNQRGPKKETYEKNFDEELCQYSFEQMTELEIYSTYAKEQNDTTSAQILSDASQEFRNDYRIFMKALEKLNEERHKQRKQQEQITRNAIIRKHEQTKKIATVYIKEMKTKIKELKRY